jgi:hypothetical protein
LLESNAIQNCAARCAEDTAGEHFLFLRVPAVLTSFVKIKYLRPLQCTGILELCASAEPLAHCESLLPSLHHTIVEEHVKCVIQAAGAGLFTTVLPDPVVARTLDGVPTFCGLFGCQMISVLVQVVYADFVVVAQTKCEENARMCLPLCFDSIAPQTPTLQVSSMLQDTFARLSLGRSLPLCISV